MKSGLILAAFLFIFGCSAEKRFARLVNQHPEFILKFDTVVYDTLITKSFRFDTSLVLKDSITIFKENVLTKIYRYNNSDSIYIFQVLRPDTIVKKILVPGKEVVVKQHHKLFEPLLVAAITMAVICFLAFWFKR